MTLVRGDKMRIRKCRRCRIKAVYDSGPSKGTNQILCCNCGDILAGKFPNHSKRDELFLKEEYEWDNYEVEK